MNRMAVVFAAAGAAMLAALFLLFRPEAVPPAAPPAAQAPADPGPHAAAPPVFELVFREGTRAGGDGRLRARQGDRVTVRVTADREDEVHLHGYDLHAHVAPGTPAVLRFTAEHAGRFELELHRAGVALATLEIQPR